MQAIFGLRRVARSAIGPGAGANFGFLSPGALPALLSGAKSWFMSPGALLEVAAGSILLLLSPNAPLQPLRKPLLGSNQPILSLWCFPASLSGTKSAFSIPNSPSAPRSKALPGSKPVILSPRVLPDGFAGSILLLLSPNIPLAPRSKAILGSRLPFLSPGVLHDGLPGSISPFLSPFDPADPLRKPFSGSKLCILIPQAFSGGACSGCRSGAGEVYTGAPPKTPAPLKPFGSACPSARSGRAIPCGPHQHIILLADPVAISSSLSVRDHDKEKGAAQGRLPEPEAKCSSPRSSIHSTTTLTSLNDPVV